MFTRQGLLLTWKEIRPYFIFAIILFFAGVVIGGSPNAPHELLGKQIEGMRSIANSIQESDNPGLAAFARITLNNIYVSLMMMALGIIVGIMPVIMLVMNGMFMGYVLDEVAKQGENVGLVVIQKILPHGIIELTAIFLAAAFGMRFGMTLLKGMFGSALGKSQSWQPFVRTATGAVPALIVVVVLLIVAGLIESLLFG
ncbi:stage II sporulation protein M [Cohnella mopanensis]|uniref:stage II sporulation protein M n=1 Tax=Cohnella mopanensis TaxID=2911966 RepID=UPI001EF8A2FF|nr:stage II sporulation protein M [Cohnella mopanensis]